MISRKILVMGLPGAGKTTLTRLLAPMLEAVVFNADEVRASLNRDLGFSLEDRIEHARRMGWLCERVVEAGHTAIADFVCPTRETRKAFGEALIVWVDRIREGRFADTNRLFEAPEKWNVRILPEGSAQFWAERVLASIAAHTLHPQGPHPSSLSEPALRVMTRSKSRMR